MGKTVDIAKYAKERAEARASGSWYKLKEDENCFRILPTPPVSQPPFIEYAMHRDVGPRKLGVRCGIDPVSREGKCWLCDVKIPALRKKGHETRAAALASKPVFLVQVAKVDEEGRMKGPFLFTPAKTVADQLLTACFANKRRSYVDPVKGYNIFLTRTGTGRNDTRYGSPEADQLPSPVPQSILDKLLPFDQLKEIPRYSAAKQQAVYEGRDAIEEVEEEEEEMVKSARHKTKPVVEPDEDEDDDEEETTDDAEEEDSEEEDEEPILKKSKKTVVAKATSKKKKQPEPEPEEDEDEDEETSADDEDEDEAEVDEDEDEEEVVAPPKKKKPIPVVKKKKSKPEPEPEEDEDEDTEDEEDENLDSDDVPDDDEEAEDEEEEALPPPPKKKKPAPVVKKKAKR